MLTVRRFLVILGLLTFLVYAGPDIEKAHVGVVIINATPHQNDGEHTPLHFQKKKKGGF